MYDVPCQPIYVYHPDKYLIRIGQLVLFCEIIRSFFVLFPHPLCEGFTDVTEFSLISQIFSRMDTSYTRPSSCAEYYQRGYMVIGRYKVDMGRNVWCSMEGKNGDMLS